MTIKPYGRTSLVFGEGLSWAEDSPSSRARAVSAPQPLWASVWGHLPLLCADCEAPPLRPIGQDRLNENCPMWNEALLPLRSPRVRGR